MQADINGAATWEQSGMRPWRDANGCVHWQLRKNCSLAPAQLAGCLACISLPGLLAGVAFLASGAPLILAYLVLQAALLAVCFVRYARHATDREVLRVSRDCMDVHIVHGAQEQHYRFSPGAVRLQLLAWQRNLVSLSEHGNSVRVGVHVPAHWRPLFFDDLCAATRGAH